MKNIKFINTLFFLLAVTSTFGQININNLEKVNGLWTKKGDTIPFTGEFKEKYENDNIKGTGNLVEGQLEGLRIQYYQNGNKITEKYYKNAYPHGHSKEFYENGILKQEGDFVDNKENGTWNVYYPNGNKHVVLNFDNGIQSGPYFEFDNQGNLTRQFYFRNNKAEYSDDFMELVNKATEMSGRFVPKETIPLYDKAIELNPTVAQVFFNRGTAYSNNFDFEKAISDYNRAIELNPNYMEAYANRGNAKINSYTSKGNLDPTPEETISACEDFHKSQELGDKTLSTSDMIYLYCKKNKKKKKE
jgi:antitoxin component YwqK of YwqJK toxin-antitoxin module